MRDNAHCRTCFAESRRSMKSCLLLHDTRSVGFINGVVLARILARAGYSVHPVYGEETTRHASTFWRKTVNEIPFAKYDEVILCSLTFDDLEPKHCELKLREIKNRSGGPPTILSHRWPDGYARCGFDVLVPPFDVLEQYAAQLLPVERDLLRLSLVMSRLIDPESVSSEEIEISDRLSRAIWENMQGYWERLLNEPEKALDELKTNQAIGRGIPLLEKGKLIASDDAYQCFELDRSVRSHAEKTIEGLLEYYKAGDRTMGLGILRDNDQLRAYIVRAWKSRNFPSIEYLLERFANECGLPEASKWLGAQNTKALVFQEIGWHEQDLAAMFPRLQKFAKLGYETPHGERRPLAGLSKVLHVAATRALESLDPIRTHTSPNEQALKFDPVQARIISEPSNRTGEARSTLVLRLIVNTPKAAAFLFKYGGYNLMKLESLLQGVLIGLGTKKSTWLGSSEIPSRLRIDTKLTTEALNLAPELWNDDTDISAIPLQKAVSSGLIGKKSCIIRALTELLPAKKRQIIVYRQSEIIGPSVQYAHVVAEIALALSVKKHSGVEVLDLFAGSGLVAKAVLAKQDSWRVWAVDLNITAAQAGVADQENIYWFKTDALSMLQGDKGFLNKHFDLISMDPPHATLFELFFRDLMLSRVRKVAPWLIVYQGHRSQQGRGIAVQEFLRQTFERVRAWNVGPEVMMIAGPNQWKSFGFDEILGQAAASLKGVCERYGWDFHSADIKISLSAEV